MDKEMQKIDSTLQLYLMRKDVPTDLKITTLKYISGLITTGEGLKYILESPKYVRIIMILSCHEDQQLNQMAHLCLVNLSATSDVDSSVLFTLNGDFLPSLLAELAKPCSMFVEAKCQILANCSRCKAVCGVLGKYLLEHPETFRYLMNQFNSVSAETRESHDYLSLFLGNLTQDDDARRLFVAPVNPELSSLLVYSVYAPSLVRRVGTAILMKNICFQIDLHPRLLEEIHILPALLIPLMGAEDYAEDEEEKLPESCRYLEPDKTRESDARTRIILMEALNKLCSTRYGRDFLRDNGAYYVLREYHKWEEDETVLEACENVVEILLREEWDVNADNLMEVNIPPEVVNRLEGLSLKNPLPDSN